MRHIFVGDIHGKIDAVNRALDMEGIKVFVGDFLDSFDESIENQIKCLDTVLAAVAANQAIALFGNHELSYLIPHHKCSGWNRHMAEQIMSRSKDMFKYLKYYHFIDGETPTLVTHAGLSNQLWNRFCKNPVYDSVQLFLQDFADKTKGPCHYIGTARGGWDECGGIFWCDYNKEFAPIEGINQIFGHTRGEDIRGWSYKNGLNYCIDCLDTKREKFLVLDL